MYCDDLSLLRDLFFLEVQLLVKILFYVLVPKWLKVHKIFKRLRICAFAKYLSANGLCE